MSHKPSRPQNKSAPGPKQQSSEKESTNRHVYVEPGVQIDFVQDIRKKYETAQGDNKTHNDKQLFWTKIAAGLLLLTAGFAGWQSCLTRESIDNNSKQFQQDQRPYVWDTGFNPPESVHIARNEVAVFSMKWINYGKSPAVKVTQRGEVLFGGPGDSEFSALKLADSFFDMLDGKLHLVATIKSLGGSAQEIAQAEAEERSLKEGATVIYLPQNIIPPGIPPNPKEPFGSSTRVTSLIPLPDFPYLLDTDRVIIAVGRTEYFDLGGSRYWSDFCLTRLKDGSIIKCPSHNEMH